MIKQLIREAIFREECQSGNIGVFLSLYHFCTLLLKTGVFAIDARQTRKNLTTKDKNLATSLKKAVNFLSAVETLPNFQTLKNSS